MSLSEISRPSGMSLKKTVVFRDGIMRLEDDEGFFKIFLRTLYEVQEHTLNMNCAFCC